MNKRRLYLACALLAVFPSVAAAGVVVSANPVDGVVSGLPGDSVGWGFTAQPDATDWVAFVTSFTLFETNPSLGFYTDFIGAQGGPVDFALPPGEIDWTQPFDPVAQTGIGSFDIDPSDLAGAQDTGTIRILYQLYAGDPNVCGATCGDGSGFMDVAFQVNVSSVPEPGCWFLLAAGLAVMAARRAVHLLIGRY